MTDKSQVSDTHIQSTNSVESVDESALLRNAKQFLVLAMDSLTLLGEEGDADTGPLIEAGTLNSLLETSS